MNAHHSGTTRQLTTAKNRSQPKESPMEAAILCIFAVTLYSIIALALIVLPPRFGDSPGEDRR